MSRPPWIAEFIQLGWEKITFRCEKTEKMRFKILHKQWPEFLEWERPRAMQFLQILKEGGVFTDDRPRTINELGEIKVYKLLRTTMTHKPADFPSLPVSSIPLALNNFIMQKRRTRHRSNTAHRKCYFGETYCSNLCMSGCNCCSPAAQQTRKL